MRVDEILKSAYDFGSYSSIRKIASYIDGFKNSQRKLFFGYKKIKKTSKVENVVNQIATMTEYIHGANNLNDVLIKMSKDYTTSNNIPYFKKDGNFGTRFVNNASAPRYIFIKPNEQIYKIYNSQDDNVLIQQEFEGTSIEPRFFVPIIPMLLVNGSFDTTPGFKQSILPRNPKELKEYILCYLRKEQCSYDLKPFYKNSKINAVKDEKSYVLYGDLEIQKETQSNIKLKITEIPPYFDLNKILEHLSKLQEKKIITSYKDYCENDKFNIELLMRKPKEYTKGNKRVLLDTLKLYFKITEIFTTIDENNKIRVFQTPEEIIQAFIKIRIEYYNKRKIYNLKTLEEKIKKIENTMRFVQLYIDGTLKINNKTKAEITKTLTDYKFNKENESYDYLLNMRLYNLTKDNILQNKKTIKDLKTAYTNIQSETPEQTYIKELKELDI